MNLARVAAPLGSPPLLSPSRAPINRWMTTIGGCPRRAAMLRYIAATRTLGPPAQRTDGGCPPRAWRCRFSGPRLPSVRRRGRGPALHENPAASTSTAAATAAAASSAAASAAATAITTAAALPLAPPPLLL